LAFASDPPYVRSCATDLTNFHWTSTGAFLLEGDRDIAIEPRAFGLLALLIMNHDRMVTKDKIIEKVWDRRIVSDAAIATAIKTTRKMLGDNGVAQKYIRTVRSRGVRFVGSVTSTPRADTRR